MVDTHWHLRITLDTSTKQRIEETARSERRSVANYVRVLLEREITARSSSP